MPLVQNTSINYHTIFGNLIMQLPSAVAYVDTDFCYVTTSRSWLSHFDLSEKTIIGKPINSGFEKYPSLITATCRETLYSRQEKNMVQHIVKNGKKDYWYKLNFNTLNDEENNVIGIFITAEDITEVQKLKKDLYANENKYKAVFENANHALFITKADGSITDANVAALQLFGYTYQEMLQKSRFELMDTSSPGLDQFLANRQRYGSARGELVNIKKNGERIICDTSSVMHYDTFGELSYSTVLIDITERKELETALSKSEILFRQAFENSGIGKALFTTKKECIKVNNSLCKTLGYSQEELLNISYHQLLHSDKPNLAYSTLKAFLLGNINNFQFEQKVKHKSGNILSFFVTIAALRNAKNALEYFVIQIEDITARKEAEYNTALAKANLKIIFDNTSEGFVLLDKDYIIKTFNQKAVDLGIYNVDKPISYGVSIFEYTEADKRATLKAGLDKVAAGESTQFDRSFTDPLGNTIWFNYALNPVFENGNFEGICISSRDITTRKNAEIKLFESEQYFRSLIENLSDCIIVYDQNMQVTYESPSVKKITGHKPSSPFVNLFELVKIPEELEYLHLIRKAILQQPEYPIRFQTRFKHKNGNMIRVEGSMTNFLNNPNIKSVVVNFKDITEKKNTEELLEKITENIPVALYQFKKSASGKFSVPYVSNVIEEIFPDKKVQDFIHHPLAIIKETLKKDFKDFMASIEYSKKMLSKWKYEFKLELPNGAHKWLLASSKPELKLDNSTIWYGYISDITERKLKEKEIQQTSAKLTNVLESIDLCFYTCDTNWTVTYWNRAAEKHTGISREMIVGKCKWDILPDNSKEKSIYNMLLKSVTQKVNLNLEQYIEPLNGWYYIESYPTDEGVTVFFRDITQHKHHIEAIEKQNKKLSAIAWDQSHLVRAPLARILGITKLIDRKTNETDTLKELDLSYFLNNLYTSAMELDKIITNIVLEANPEDIPDQKSNKSKSNTQAIANTTDNTNIHPDKVLQVLLVDDDEFSRLIIEQTLIDNGFCETTSQYANGRLALDYLQSIIQQVHTHFLIFLDINMPELDGWAFLDALQNSQYQDNVSVIMLTSSVNTEDKKRCAAYPQVISFISKPFTHDQYNSIKLLPAISAYVH